MPNLTSYNSMGDVIAGGYQAFLRTWKMTTPTQPYWPLCAALKVDPPLQPQEIAISHWVSQAATRKSRQVLVEFSSRNIREKVFKAKENIKTERK